MNIDSNTFMFIALAIIMALVIICFILNAVNSSKISTLMEYSDDGDIISALRDYYEKVEDLSKTINDSSDAVFLKRLEDCENEAHISVKKIGITNFDAFDDVKGNMSFSLALLNNNDDGIILTSLYGHNSCNTYLREVTNGETSVKLMNEEREALDKAKNKLKKADE
ncbi:MAG: DUF4446 family protein [Clostridia bacterium]|nr:DUF4446 family protein [Clostridia bacterium]